MMQVIKNYIFYFYNIIICIFLICYLILISILSIPNNPISLDYAKIIKNYTKNFARQDYFVFTPIPTNHYHIFLTYHKNDSPDLTLDIYNQLIIKHHKYPFSHYEKKLALHHYLAISVIKKILEKSDIKETIEYNRLIKLIKFYKPANYTHGSLVIKKIPTQPFTERQNINNHLKDDVVFEIQHIEL